ncbi:hypothetical protein QBC40DRAFT_328031 [Triangularia verruculosa]|uniref:Uncharacterized protein n=1 Tax=Triangularia verruculosa TaxID=2587418 RepID=A0AAN6XFU9_9PEZI|nr:hypothetical protein QBC40DRAFT_328031 [Triangularia verruculosa]
MGPPVPIPQAAKKVFKGTKYCYGFPNSEQPVVLNINSKLRNFERTKLWGETSRAEWRDYISIYPRLYQVAKKSRERIEHWLRIGNNRTVFDEWGPAFRAFLRTEQQDHAMNTHVRKPGIPPEATWLGEDDQQKGADFDERMGRSVAPSVQQEGDGGEEEEEEEEEEEKYRPGDEHSGREESFEQIYSHVDRVYAPNGNQRPNKRKRENQTISQFTGTPFPPAVLARLPVDRQVAHILQQQFALVELRAAAEGFKTLHSEILRVAQRLERGDPLRSLLSSIAGTANLDVLRVEGAVKTSSELVDYLATARAEAARSDDPEEEARIKRARAKAAYEMLPAAPANPQRPNVNLTRDGQVPEATFNTRSPTAPRDERVSSYELPDDLARAYQPLFERSSPVHHGPSSSHAGRASSRPNTAADVQTIRPQRRGTPGVASTSLYYRQTLAAEFNPVNPINHNDGWDHNTGPLNAQPQSQFRHTTLTQARDMPVNYFEGPAHPRRSHRQTPYYPPPLPEPPADPTPPNIQPTIELAQPTVELPQIPPNTFHSPEFGVATRRTTRATSVQTAQPQERQVTESDQEPQASVRQTRQSSRQPTPSSSSRPPLRPVAAGRQSTAGRGVRQGGRIRNKYRIEEEEEEEEGKNE